MSALDLAADPLERMLTRLKLTAVRDTLESLLDEIARRELTQREALVFLCEREIARKDERRIEMGLSIARFPFVRDLGSFDFAAQPSLDPRQLRELATGRFVIVALSGYGTVDDRRRSAEAGFDAHVVKPVGFEALQLVLKELSGGRTAAPDS